MRYLSVCSGIEAASAAWHPLNWEPLAFSEIEPFPRKVLAHHYPDVPLHGDFTVLREQDWIKNADILVGGTPCQAFSVAGLRNSLDDDRGNLTLEFVRLADAIDNLRHAGNGTIIVWENVPGVLSVKDNAFGCFLGALVGNDEPIIPTGGKWTNAGMVMGPQRRAAWRVLDAQYFGVAQRRRRVFVVASARDGFDPAEILFEREGLRRDTPPSREKGQEVAATIASRFGNSRNNHEEVVSQYTEEVSDTLSVGANQTIGRESPSIVAHITGNANELDFCVATTVQARMGSGGFDLETETPIVVAHVTGPITAGISKGMRGTEGIDSNWAVVQPIVIHGTQDPCVSDIAFAQGRNNGGENVLVQPIGFEANMSFTNPSDEGVYHTLTRRHHAAVAQTIAIDERSIGRKPEWGGNGSGVNEGGSMYNLNATGVNGVAQPIVYDTTNITSPHNGSNPKLGDPCFTLAKGQHPPLLANMAVRRLTPRECERLQGFPDDYTAIPGAADGPRYKSLGNSMAVPVMAWIGTRINNATLKGE